MAFYVLLLKEHEDDQYVVYKFGPHEEALGRLRLDKATGVVDEIDPVTTINPQAFFNRAAVKVRQHWRTGNFPDRSSWSS